ncbi:metal ABC transporter substrate-binding protein [Helcococcus kunzii]|uniref:metal ABC transporter substrate-binding protein n=1 Tax=Helcococcus kunzii TaxID=40091 RepID=UPI0024AE5717|nr:zinc ABC transporter substrate-binding protein [Helcococcus kunzii]
MNKIKKLMMFLFAMCMLLSACGKSNTKTEKNDKAVTKSEKKIIYTTFFPVTELTKRIVGDKFEIKQIIENNDEPHSFELKTNDMRKLTYADLVIYNGANMEGFIPDLKNALGEEKFLDLSQGLTLLETKSDLETKNHDAVNPHTWLSIKNAIEQLDTIYKKISSIDPENKDFYKKNFEDNKVAFEEMDKKFKESIAKINKKDKYFVVSHAAFNYLADDYGLKQVAVTGISPEEEPTAKQLKDIADFVKKNDINTIFFEGKATPKVAETLAKNTNTKTGTMYTMENLSEEEKNLGYLDLMQKNLDALMESFND